MPIDIDPVPIPLEAIPAQVQPLLDAGRSPVARRMIVARAALPLPAEQLVPCLAWLCRDPDQEVRRQARSSIEELPLGTLDGFLARQDVNPGVLDTLGRVVKDVRLLGRIVVNRTTPNPTLNYLGRTSDKAVLLEILGRNQDRIAKQPDLVEALYFNPNTPMRIAQSVIEFAVRQGLPIQHIPGYKEIVEGLLGKDFQVRQAPAAPAGVFTEEPTSPEAAPPAPDAAEGFDDFGTFGDEGGGDEGFEEGGDEDEKAFLARLAKGEGLEERDDEDELSEFDRLLRAAAEQGEEAGEAGEDGPLGKALHNIIGQLEVPERIRMALVGNSSARAILIHDRLKMVSTSVLENPGLSVKEIALFALNRALPDDLIRTIAQNRDWVRHYAVKVALVQNPKTPPNMAVGFLKFLNKNDLKAIARSREVPGLIQKMAKVMMQRADNP
jgi:hypothetical protein